MSSNSRPDAPGTRTSSPESRAAWLAARVDTSPAVVASELRTGASTNRRAFLTRSLSTGFIALAALALGSCEESVTTGIGEYCAAARDPLLLTQSQPPNYSEGVPPSAVLVVEESTAPGCQPWDWNGDHTACINATIAQAQSNGTKYVGLTRGRQYRYSDRIYILPNTVLMAVGDPARDRPILATNVPVWDGIALESGAEIRNLDIRGPHYGKNKFPVQKQGDWAYKGINGANSSGWAVLGTSVSGFAGTGILAAQSNDIRIEGNTISRNGYSGISLFYGDSSCGRGARVVGNVIEYNGEDGIDTCASDVLFANNTIRYNGWDLRSGDRNGLLVFAWAKGGAEKIQIVDNNLYGNGESGIRISGITVSDIVIRGNYMTENGHWGLDPGAPEGALSRVEVRNNSCGRNILGCLNKKYLNGVEVTPNSCFQ